MFGDMMGMMGKVKEFQARLQESAEAGAGMVKATVNGRKQVVSLEIDPDLVKAEEKEMLQDLIVAAINRAMTKIDEQVKEHIRQQTDGILPNIPGFDLSKFMK